MNNVILSGKHPEFSAELAGLGYRVINSDSVDCFIPYERDHADMQCLFLDDTAFVLSRCEGLIKALDGRYQIVRCGDNISAKYPENVALNALVLGRRLIARLDSLDDKVKSYCIEHNYEFIHVRQGYAKCACAAVSDNAIITADKGIYYSLKEYKADVLLIQEGRVTLEGANCGFIGGASGLDISGCIRRLYFSGNIKNHPDYQRIRDFCSKYDTEIISLTNNELTDIGGMLFC